MFYAVLVFSLKTSSTAKYFIVLEWYVYFLDIIPRIKSWKV